ncbi:PLP-dependent aminotransferase family protein [Flavobacterium sp. NKUCC04_CG]|uniref:aminotransferase-like domain-containing protein n=1 Tax=Flavobacterium sp. NKUCC04_CG TaxID=2842121 RepID=UPI001C5A6A59|nr:PLP-dependent aminotransferase family protein [Flavobacterium sp. NKUCC04_CG]MBW3518542.1 PLP-dependent aminotransferase family protein [Flavobacterium sp. NKUCC04_CG]
MNSPVDVPFKSFIVIDRQSSTAVYLQIATQIINAIQRGYLVAGTALPGSRSLAKTLEVHRNTIVSSFDELNAQGWIDIVPNKGTFVAGKKSQKPQKINSFLQTDLAHYPTRTGFVFKKNNILDHPVDQSKSTWTFTDGIPDIRLSQIAQLSKWYSAHLQRKSSQKHLGYHQHEGNEYFKENLANFLNLSRGLHISKSNIMITRGIEMGIYIATEMLIEPMDVVLVGELSYYATNMIFQKAGATLLSVPMDEEGIDVDAVKRLCETTKIRMLYLTPHHHYPTTVTLSVERRIELLRLSAQYGFIILEDDYDYDFHYNSSPILPLASADSQGMVVYIGSFCKSLAPGFRTGFIVAPEELIRELHKFLNIIDQQGDVLMEGVLGEMIVEGEINRHLKKVSKIYQQRRDDFADLLQSQLNPYIDFTIPTGGLAIWTQWDTGLNLMRISKECLKQDLYLPTPLLYQSKNITAMRLGFGNFNQNEMELVVDKLYIAVKKSM